MQDSIVVSRNEDIVHVDEEPTSIELFDEDIVHHVLERCGRVAESEEHYSGLKEAIFCNEGSERFVSFCNPDVVVSRECHGF